MGTTLLTFLGAGRYETVTYVWNDADGEKAYTTHLFPEAAANIFQPDRVVVCVTPAARAYKPPLGERCSVCGQVLPEPKETRTYLEGLQERLGTLRLVPLDIPEGRSESELWVIFDRIAGIVRDREELVLDVTHAFRSLPLLVFGVAAYLRRVKNVVVRRIIYGAYEARTLHEEHNRAPVFDLTPLLGLMDWLSGIEAFLKRGDSRTLADQMRQVHDSLWREQAGREQAVEELPRKLQNVAGKLQSLSGALHLSRPRDVMQIAHGLRPMLDSAQEELQQWAKRFAIILGEVRRELDKLAYEQPDCLDVENLRKQLALVEYYLKKDLIVQAITLAREWVVSRAILERGEGNWLNLTEREQVEKDLGGAVQKWCRNKTQTNIPEWLERWFLVEKVAQTWDWLTKLRNDVSHCGMRSDATPAKKIAQEAKEIPERLRLLLDEAPEGVLWGGRVAIDLKALYGDTAKLDELPLYLERAKEQAGEGNEVILTGQAPIWLYLAVAHALHGKARRLWYSSPVTGEILIFDHSTR